VEIDPAVCVISKTGTCERLSGGRITDARKKILSCAAQTGSPFSFIVKLQARELNEANSLETLSETVDSTSSKAVSVRFPANTLLQRAGGDPHEFWRALSVTHDGIRNTSYRNVGESSPTFGGEMRCLSSTEKSR
jgi:hypothetical protein